MKVYECIRNVMKDLSHDGISKDRKNQQQGYQFRGIDDVYNALSASLSNRGLVILPRILSRHCDERQTKSGGNLFYVTVEAEFDLIATEDDSKHTVKTYGEAMDSADKATNKAMSAAYKYMAMQTFCIPTEGDNDADAHTPEPTSKQHSNNGQSSKPSSVSADTARNNSNGSASVSADTAQKPAPAQPSKNSQAPKSGYELYEKIRKADKALFDKGAIAEGDFVARVDRFAEKFPGELANWNDEQIATAWKFANEEYASLTKKSNNANQAA